MSCGRGGNFRFCVLIGAGRVRPGPLCATHQCGGRGGRFSSYALSNGEAMSLQTIHLLALLAIAGVFRGWEAGFRTMGPCGMEACTPRPSAFRPLLSTDDRNTTEASSWCGT